MNINNNYPNEIIKICIPQIVKIRKYSVDIESLKKQLIDAKKRIKITNKQISYLLNKPITLVEHWFRKDNCFSIPDEDVWYQLKELLNINTEEFDKGITEFIYKKGEYEKSERCYLDIGIAPTLTTVNTDEKIIITDDEYKIGDLKWIHTE